jgi:hypothetical protein
MALSFHLQVRLRARIMHSAHEQLLQRQATSSYQQSWKPPHCHCWIGSFQIIQKTASVVFHPSPAISSACPARSPCRGPPLKIWRVPYFWAAVPGTRDEGQNGKWFKIPSNSSNSKRNVNGESLALLFWAQTRKNCLAKRLLLPDDVLSTKSVGLKPGFVI